MANIRSHVFVEGRVQGVFFRAETREAAKSFGVTGWVRNLYDGRVEAVFEGGEEEVERAVDWCHKGPPHATVTHVEVSREPYTRQIFNLLHQLLTCHARSSHSAPCRGFLSNRNPHAAPGPCLPCRGASAAWP